MEAKQAKVGAAKIEHVVVLMLENRHVFVLPFPQQAVGFVVTKILSRSLDHMCGFLKAQNGDIDGLNGNESNPFDPQNPSKGAVKVPTICFACNQHPAYLIFTGQQAFWIHNLSRS